MANTERRNGGQIVEGQMVHAGEIVLVHDGSRLISVVGSGIVVCIWEASTGLAALAQFVKPRATDLSHATAKYGNAAILKLIEMIEEHRVAGFSPEAQIFGAAHKPEEDANKCIGAKNLEVARKILEAKGIPIVSEDVGGVKGRKIMFDSASGLVAVVRVHKLRDEDWNPK